MEHPRTLAQPNPDYIGDTGTADELTRALIANVSDHKSYVRALVALCNTRLFLAIVAKGDDTMAPDPNRHAEMSAVTLEANQEKYLLVFTGNDSLQAWRKDARPVPSRLTELAAAVEMSDATALLVDSAGPHSLVITGEALKMLADGYVLVEFEDDGFSWVKFADPDKDEGPEAPGEGSGRADPLA